MAELKKNLFKMTDVRIRVLVFLVILTVFSLINPTVISLTNIVGLINNSIFNGIAALGMLVVMVTGNFDLSSMSIAMFSAYGTLLLYMKLGYQGDYITMFLIAGLIGGAVASITGYITRKFELSGFVVSIGMNMILSSVLFIFMKSAYIKQDVMPKKVIQLSYDSVFSLDMPDGTRASLNIGFWVLLAVIVGVWVLLNKTQIGRGIYALGGDKVALERVGFNVPLVYTAAYATFGFCCGVAGIFFYANMSIAEPGMILNKGSNVIASAIFGGCNMKDGKGSVGGVLSGVAIITLVNDNLVLLGVPPYAKILVIGIIILLSVLLSSITERRTAIQ